MQWIGHIPAQWIRNSLYRARGMAIGVDSVIYGGCEIRRAAGIQIGDGTSIGHRCILDGRFGLSFGDSVNVSTGAWFWSAQHDINSKEFEVVGGPIVVNDYAWIGGRTIILPGITIGRGAVVASGAVVTRSVEDYCIVAGIPAKPIGVRTRDFNYKCGPGWPFI